MPIEGVPSDNTTVVEVLAELVDAGFDAAMVMPEDGDVRCTVCGAVTGPEEQQLNGLRRLEGASDPADMQAVLALTCPACGARGTAVVAYGPGATPGEAQLLTTVDDHRPGSGQE
ncbi:hypothetical protein BH24ACT3_BH24ACT3_00110 [soil metagenome]